MSEISEQIEFLKIIEKVTVEFDAAYETRKEDTERWEAAKAAFQEQRSFWRSVSEADRPDPVSHTVTAEPISADGKVHKKGDN